MAETRRIDTRGLAKVARMKLVARQAVEGFVSGKHPSPYHGSSVEYADHRPYTLGDEIRTIDWKLLAKTDKYFIKLFEEQTNVRATILLDISRSMAFGAGPAPAALRDVQTSVTKLDYCCYLASALAYLMLRQNDSVGLCLFDSQVRTHLPCRSTPSHFRRMLELMDQVNPRHETSVGEVLHDIATRLKRRGMIIVISDLIDDLEPLTDGLAHFRHNHHDVIVFHVLDEAELNFPYQRLTRFKDIEGSGTVVASPQQVRERYLDRLQAFLTKVKGACLERGVSYELASTATPYDQMLMAYLHKRARRSY
jgi:uncharacterized protein (DUF58 family)